MLIAVTEKEIKEGCRGSADECPVALALNRATNQEWSVCPNALSPSIGGSFYDDEIPRNVKQFIEKFDAGESVKPFTFVLSSGERYVV